MSDEAQWDAWFEANRALLEDAYLGGQSAWQQSGFGLHSPRDEHDWRALRHPVADCLLAALSDAQRAQPVNFLDIGCANGYLLECCVGWARVAGVALIPWGLDISDGLVALARQRLPVYAQGMFSGNAWSWTPPRRFDAMRTELVYVPEPLRLRYVARLLDEFLTADGLLLVAEYAGRTPDGNVSTLSVDETLRAWGYEVAAVRSGIWQGIERTRIACVRR
jgi:SAM-dependent methyltransferase